VPFLTFAQQFTKYLPSSFEGGFQVGFRSLAINPLANPIGAGCRGSGDAFEAAVLRPGMSQPIKKYLAAMFVLVKEDFLAALWASVVGDNASTIDEWLAISVFKGVFFSENVVIAHPKCCAVVVRSVVTSAVEIAHLGTTRLNIEI